MTNNLRQLQGAAVVPSEVHQADSRAPVTPEGKVTWQVPGDFAQPEAQVILGLRDASRQEAFQVFTLRVR